MKTNKNTRNPSCPCQNEDHKDKQNSLLYSECCQPVHLNITKANTAEALMRARYCAYVLCDETFLLNSWHPETRPAKIPFDPQLKWTGLKIKAKKAGSINDVAGEVEFIARCKNNGKASRIHETSQFKRYEGYWVYLDGQLK